MSIKHKKQSAKPNGSDATRIQPSDWNDDHEIDELILPKAINPTVPLADNVTVFGRSVGGRMMPAFVGPSGLDTSVQPFLGRNTFCSWNAAGNSTTVTISGAAAALTATGTATTANIAVTTQHTRMKRLDYLATTAATTAVAGWRQSTAMFCRLIGYHLIVRGAPATGQATTSTTGRFYMGLASITSAPTDVLPSTLLNALGIGFEAGDTNLFFYQNDGSGTCTRTSLGADFPRYSVDRATIYELVLFAAPNAAAVMFEVTDLATGKKAIGTISGTEQPLENTFLAARTYASVGGTSSVIGVTFCSMYVETDY